MAMVKQHSPDGTRAGFHLALRQQPEGPTARAYRLWMTSVLQPLNERAATIVQGGFNLLEGDAEMEAQLLQLVAHVSACRVILQRWAQGELTTKSAISYPEKLEEMVRQEFARVKQRQADLLGVKTPSSKSWWDSKDEESTGDAHEDGMSDESVSVSADGGSEVGDAGPSAPPSEAGSEMEAQAHGHHHHAHESSDEEHGHGHHHHHHGHGHHHHGHHHHGHHHHHHHKRHALQLKEGVQLPLVLGGGSLYSPIEAETASAPPSRPATPGVEMDRPVHDEEEREVKEEKDEKAEKEEEEKVQSPADNSSAEASITPLNMIRSKL